MNRTYTVYAGLEHPVCEAFELRWLDGQKNRVTLPVHLIVSNDRNPIAQETDLINLGILDILQTKEPPFNGIIITPGPYFGLLAHTTTQGRAQTFIARPINAEFHTDFMDSLSDLGFRDPAIRSEYFSFPIGSVWYKAMIYHNKAQAHVLAS